VTSEAQHLREPGLKQLREALETGTLRSVQRMVNALHPAEIADLLESLPPPERNVVWDLVDSDSDGDVLVELKEEVRTKLLEGMDADELVAAMNGMDLDDLADLVPDLPEAVIHQVIQSMDSQDRQRLQSVLAYDEDTAGGLMDPDVVTVRPNVSIEVVLRYLRMRGSLPDGTDALFVVNSYGRYVGCLYLSSLLTSDPGRTVAELMDTGIDAIQTATTANEVATLFETRDLLTAPVISADGRLAGRITVDDVLDVIREEAEHSILSMAGLAEDEDMFAPVLTSTRRRAIWLGVNLATAFIAASVVGLFQATIDQVVALAVLMPIVASMGGIAGSQTLTLIVRGLALGQVQGSNAPWLMRREMLVGLLNGLGWAAVVAAATVIWFRSWQLGGIIAAALLINLLIAALSGVLIPLILRRMRIDPALAGSVVLTTVTDVVGFMVFLGLGALLLT
jgi:magnesium transporter